MPRKSRSWRPRAQCIFRLGGITRINTYTKLYLCFIGQYDYEAVPAIPPEIVLFPNWFWFNIYEISSWSRAILVPLSICYAHKPLRKIAPERGIEELFPDGPENTNMHLEWDSKLVSWRNFFLVLNTLVHWFERIHIRPLRKIAIKKAEEWMLERFEMSDGLGAIYPAMLNAILALRCLGYSMDDPQVIRAVDEFEKLGIREQAEPEEGARFRMQPAVSPVWDTAYAIFALERERRARGRSAAGARRRMDAQEAGHAQGRLGGEGARMSSPADGISSSTTSSTPTWTTAPWCCWRSTG